MIIEDVRTFVPFDQMPHLIWLGQTYNDRPDFSAKSLENPKDAQYSAPTFAEWYRDLHKLDQPIASVIQMLRESIRENKSLSEILQRNYFKQCLNLF